jgi:hypothetical protein
MTATNASGDLSPDLLFDGAHFVDLHGPDGWPAAEHLIVFKPRPDSFVSGLALYIAHDRIVAAQAGCNTPEQLVRDADGELPLIWRPR